MTQARPPDPEDLDREDLDAETWKAIAAAAAGAATPVPQAPPLGPVDWKHAYREDHGLGHGQASTPGERPATPPSAPAGWMPPALELGSVAPRPSPLVAGERVKLRQAVRRGAPEPGLGNPVHPGNLDAVLAYLYRPAMDALVGAIASEDLFGYAARTWRPAVRGAAWWADHVGRKGNEELLNHLYDRLSKLMGACFDFEPVPLAWISEMPAGALGLFLPSAEVIAVSARHLGGPVHEVVSTLVHEQIHAFQFELMGRVRRGHRLEPLEHGLVELYLREECIRRPGQRSGLALETMAYRYGDEAAAAMARWG